MSTCISHKIVLGDTLQRLASRYNVTSWEDIVYINGLQYPFIIDEIALPSTQRLPNIKYIGDNLLIPVENVSTIDYVSDAELQKRTYGVDMFLDFETDTNGIQNFEKQGELTDDSSGDIKQAIGIENIRQALLTRLSTNYGELPMHLDYGSDFMTMIGKPKTLSNLTKMKLEVISTFKKDTRVSNVRNCIVKSVPNGVTITCDIILVTPNEKFTFSETFVTV
jgi:phage baseplate assembly protein W